MYMHKYIIFVIVYIIKHVVMCINMWIRYTPYTVKHIEKEQFIFQMCGFCVCIFNQLGKMFGKKIVSAWGIKGPFLLLLSPQKYYTAIIYTAFTLYQGLWVMWTWLVHTRKGRGYTQTLHYLYETWASQIWGPRGTRYCRTKHTCSARDTCIQTMLRISFLR